MTRPPPFATLRAFWWADRALRAARQGLSSGRMFGLSLPTAPRLPAGGRRGVEARLRFRGYTCLEQALVRQRFLASQGAHQDVVIGVRSTSTGFVAHAWLDGEEDPAAPQFLELTRLPA
jgi:hypothetical protein